MRLDVLMQPFGAAVPEGVEVSGLSMDSRAIAPGSVFLACAGMSVHGARFSAGAEALGAVAIIYEPKGLSDSDRDVLESLTIPAVACERLSEKAGDIAARFYDNPAESMTLVGVTGTDGKSSVVNLWAQIMRLCGQRVASLGTLGLDCGEGVRAGTHTTPDPVQLQADLAAARDAGCSALAMEVSSHAIDQGRIDGLRFAHVALTNLGRDHLDYHASVAEYHACKRRLLSWPGVQSVHLNGDAAMVRRAWDQTLAENASADPAEGCLFGGAADARWQVREVEATAQGLHIDLQVGEQSFNGDVGLYGLFNACNLMAAASLAERCGAPVAEILGALPSVETVKGRMQRVPVVGAPLALIDYAHTPQALEAALASLREHKPHQIICVFGCGGDRDRGKRALMAAAAEKGADRVILTDDNPRSEDPVQIFADVQAGFRNSRAVRAIHDRAEAIAEAVSMTGPEDILLVAGKGHEEHQLVGIEKRPFSDEAVLRAALQGAGA